MSVYNIYFSPTGGTRKVMGLLSSAWGEVTALDFSMPHADYGRWHFSKEDICLIGVPSFEGRVPPVALDRLTAMRGDHTPTVLVTVFGNRDFNDTLLELKQALLPLGFLPFAAVSAVARHSMLPQVATGRPDATDQEELRDFSLRLRKAAEAPSALTPVSVPGQTPYIVIPVSPTYPKLNMDTCTHCMSCAQLCPAAAIDKADPSETDLHVCARCMRCVSVCPTGARFIDPTHQKAAARRLAHLFVGRKPNTIYY